ncbi:MAG: rRNA pseudouridine synthase [Chloroflexi bacterium]|nr:rRNA pseudouridine synthase [Chloroflexota bacterium]
MTERLQKALAKAGVASRREAERLMRAGRVAVDGAVVTELGTKIDPTRQRVTLDGRPLGAAPPGIYWLLHKPPGYLTTTRDPQGRPTILDLLPRGVRVYPVGRLDAASEGLLLLTNDGALAHRLAHPSSQVPKEYHVLVDQRVDRALPERLDGGGVVLDDGRIARAEVRLLRAAPDGSWLRFVLREGRKRQVRRMCAALGLGVLRLRRVRLDGVALGALPPGRYRPLSAEEVERLQRAAGVWGAEASGHRPGDRPGDRD